MKLNQATVNKTQAKKATALKRQRGFSLIEIMVVIVIMGLMLGVVGPMVFDKVGDAQIGRIKGDFATMKTALQSYRLDNYNYPTTEQGLEALVSKTDIDPVPRKFPDEGYIEKLPKDPWQRPYVYIAPSDEHPFDVYTLGRDGVEGGEGEDADLSYWDDLDDR